ncbi:hypothetical protein GQX74_014170 [Glossina fuscipes]|nr:hypothetical protein GQX74_014170 [Glossina fuscipes]
MSSQWQTKLSMISYCGTYPKGRVVKRLREKSTRFTFSSAAASKTSPGTSFNCCIKYLPVAKARLDKFNSPLRRANFNNFSVNIVLSSEGSRLRNIGFKLRNVGRSVRRGGARERRQNDSAEVCGFELAADILRCILTICVYSFTYVIPLKQ